jgi:transitional endoplasmic reticulum ATPase
VVFPRKKKQGSDLRSKFVGESEKRIAEIFRDARAAAPCILLIDQLDVILPERGSATSSENSEGRIVSCFLTELDGIFSRSIDGFDGSSDVLVIGTTSRPEIIDKAITRPGRFDKHIKLPLPDLNSRQAIMRLKLSKVPHSCTETDIYHIALNSEGFSPVDLEGICREAAMLALREELQNAIVRPDHLWLALQDSHR